MAGYRVDIRPRAAEVIRHLPPEVKRAVKAAIRSVANDPMAGESLHGELEGRHKFRVRRYRIVYRIDKAEKIIRVIAVGHRRSVYEDLAERSGDDE